MLIRTCRNGVRTMIALSNNAVSWLELSTCIYIRTYIHIYIIHVKIDHQKEELSYPFKTQCNTSRNVRAGTTLSEQLFSVGWVIPQYTSGIL